jgi:serine/threonine-protein kinase ULK/ATG1
VFVCVARGLAYLRSKGIIHRDLKPQNILLHKETISVTSTSMSSSDLPASSASDSSTSASSVSSGSSASPATTSRRARYHFKLADFGFARYLEQDLAATFCGSPLYMAPEVLAGQSYDGAADMWSVVSLIKSIAREIRFLCLIACVD